MIVIKEKNDPSVVCCEKFQLVHDKEEVIELARDLFRSYPDIRDQAVAVKDRRTREILYYLSWKSNLSPDISEQMLKMFNPYVSELWRYHYYDDRMDFDILERAEVFLFDILEEYTYAVAKILQAYFPDKYVFFKDPKALWFFEQSDHFKVIEGDSDLFNHYHFILQKSIMTIKSDVLQFAPQTRDPMNYINKKYVSTELMVGLYWMADEMRFGEKNPEKTFFLIRSPLGMMGLSDLIRWTLYRAAVAEAHKKGKIIPVVDHSVPGDNNQFNGGDGTNAWTLFFEQLTDIPLEEVYQSKNVIRGEEQLFMANPYIKEESLFADYAVLFRKYLRFNKTSQRYSDEMYEKVIPKSAKRVLGVIGRGTDYNQSFITTVLNQPSGPAAFLNRVREVAEAGDYDCIFLATEDENVFRTFMDSDLAEKTVYVEQERVDYNDKEYNDRFLKDIYDDQDKDRYAVNLRYLSIIYILSRCTSLIASTDCGAYLIATGLNNHQYEYTELFMKSDEKA